MRLRSVLAGVALLLLTGGAVEVSAGPPRLPPQKRPAVKQPLKPAAKPQKRSQAKPPKKAAKAPAAKKSVAGKQTAPASKGLTPQQKPGAKAQAKKSATAAKSTAAKKVTPGNRHATVSGVQGTTRGRPISPAKKTATAEVRGGSGGPRKQDVKARLDRLRRDLAQGGPTPLYSRGLRPPPGSRAAPKGIPAGWLFTASKKNGGFEYYDPKNPANRVRVMPGNPASQYPKSRTPYVRWTRDGRSLDAAGNESNDLDETHIPLEQFRFNPDVFR